jgi:hypothetical protein
MRMLRCDALWCAEPASLVLDLPAAGARFMPGLPAGPLFALLRDCFAQEMVAYRSPVTLIPLSGPATPGCLEAVLPSSRVVVFSGRVAFQLR